MESKSLKIGLIILVVVLLAVLGISVTLILKQRNEVKELNELTEQMNYEKQMLTEEYSDFAVQFENQKFQVGNDSLLKLLDSERQKVRSLLDELRTVKATNVKRVNELKAELASVRKVMMHYVAQIDSLNAANQRLTVENTEVKRQYSEASQTVASLSKERETLNEKINLAARLETSAIVVSTLNDRGKAVTKLNKVAKISVCFKVSKNVTAPVGDRVVYLRIIRPDNNPLIKSEANTFNYENRAITYSAKKIIEYTGDEQDVCMYWNVEEVLFPGNYRADIFADGNLIGQKSFKIEN